MTSVLEDVLPVLARLSKCFQKGQVDITTITDGVTITTAFLVLKLASACDQALNYQQVPSVLAIDSAAGAETPWN
jgi:hypothetical protein